MSTSSSRSADIAGGYISPVDTPIAPSVEAAHRSRRPAPFAPRRSSGRAASPAIAIRSGRWPTSGAVLSARPRPLQRSRVSGQVGPVPASRPGPDRSSRCDARVSPATAGGSGTPPIPQLPLISVVTPWPTLLRARPSLSRVRSEWLCRSTQPGATTDPSASILSRRPSRRSARSPIATIRPSSDPDVGPASRCTRAVDDGPARDQRGPGSAPSSSPVQRRRRSTRRPGPRARPAAGPRRGTSRARTPDRAAGVAPPQQLVRAGDREGLPDGGQVGEAARQFDVDVVVRGRDAGALHAGRPETAVGDHDRQARMPARDRAEGVVPAIARCCGS